MKHIALAFLICTATSSLAQSTGKEKTVKAYYAAYEAHDWNLLAGQIANDFTFTSPAGDNNISVQTYKEKCWPTNKFLKKVNFIKMAEKGNDVFLLVEINTTDNKIARNLDVFSFNKEGKIKSHECFFGTGIGYPGNTASGDTANKK